jgi:hypothetical protein
MSWADRVEQVLRLIDEVVHGRATAPLGAETGGTPALSPGYAGSPAGRGSSWAS